MPTENKEIVQQALATLLATGKTDALEHLLSEDFLHHRPDATTSTKKEWLANVRKAMIPLANMQVEIHHLLSDADHVVMHSHRHLPGENPEVAVVDIWRFKNGKITEAWELIEPKTQAPTNLTWWHPTPTTPTQETTTNTTN